MCPIPATKAAQLINDINEIAHSDIRDEIALARIRRQAEALLPYHREGAFMVLGAVSSLVGDEEAMHRYHGSSVECSVNKAEAYFNYATSLLWRNDFSGALELLKKSYALDHYPRTVRKMILCAQHLGLYGMADRLFQELEKIEGASIPENERPSLVSVVRDDVMSDLEQDIAEFGDLWKDLAKV
jgi:tetratricopeptide (TPR) repeat protein